MGTPPLQVRLLSAAASYVITDDLLDDLTIRNSAPGGFTAASCSLRRPLDLAPPELSTYTEFEVIDTRNAEQVFYGHIEDPGRTSGGVWALSVVGGGSHATDVAKPVVYNDSRNTGWRRTEEQVMPKGTWSQGNSDSSVGDTPQVFTIPDGTVMPSLGRVVARYDLLRDTGQHIALAYSRHTDGRISSSFAVEHVGRLGPATDAELPPGGQTVTTAGSNFASRLGSTFTTLHTSLDLRLIWLGAAGTGIVGDTTWAKVTQARVFGTRKSRLGVEKVALADYQSGVGANVSWLPEWIVEDVLGRFCPEWDRAVARIDTTSPTVIYQMAYDDITTAQQVLDDLMALCPTHYWAAWGNDNGRGAVFVWQSWPTVVGLDGLDAKLDQFDAPGSAADLYNEVSVRWVDPNGVARTTVVTGTCPALTAAGLTRRGTMDLGSQLGDSGQATTAGRSFLDAHQYPSNTGTIKTSRPLVDAVTGRELQPWQIRSGVLARVRNLEARPDAQNATSNGQTLFRVSDVSYSAKDNTATLTLDSYGRTLARALSKLTKAVNRTPRR